MKNIVLVVSVLICGMPHAAAQSLAPLPGAELLDPFPQPSGWVAVEGTLEINGTTAGRFWRTSDGSTRFEYATPDTRGITIEIRNVTYRKYYVYRPVSGWRVQPMVLPTAGWVPEPVARAAVGQQVSAAGAPFEVYERTRLNGVTEQRIPSLNFLTVRETRADGTIRTLSNIKVQAPVASLMEPPLNAVLTQSAIPGGIVALPSPRR